MGCRGRRGGWVREARRRSKKKSRIGKITCSEKCLFFASFSPSLVLCENLFFSSSLRFFNERIFFLILWCEKLFSFSLSFQVRPHFFFSSSMVCEWVLLNFFSRVSLFYGRRAECSKECRTGSCRAIAMCERSLSGERLLSTFFRGWSFAWCWTRGGSHRGMVRITDDLWWSWAGIEVDDGDSLAGWSCQTIKLFLEKNFKSKVPKS